MRELNPESKRRSLATDAVDYVRFLVLGEARTGSSVLVQALNSSPHVRCFREVFNADVDFVDFQMDGYDNFSAQDLALRSGDPLAFLRERIFCPHPDPVRAVGFKLLYGQVWSFPNVLDRLVEDTEIRVLHLRRRNLLRALVSLQMAQRTGVWLEDRRSMLSWAKALTALRHPLRATTRLPRLLRPATPFRKAPPVQVTISEQEFLTFMVRTEMTASHFDNLFREHPKLTVFYEDLLDRREEVFHQAQAFLGLDPRPLTVTLRRQNPELLRDLLANYDELYEAFRGTPYAWMFE